MTMTTSARAVLAAVLALGLALAAGCDAAKAPASKEDKASQAEPASESKAGKPDDKPSQDHNPADRPNDETTAGLKELPAAECLAACVKRSQARAVSPEQIEADCRRTCRRDP